MLNLDKLTRIELEEATEFLLREFMFINSVDLVIQLGSGQKPEGLLDEEWGRQALQQMPGMPNEESLARHNLEAIWGITGDVKVLIYAGRYHYYEGYGRMPCILPIWAAAECGARNFLFCNAAGGIADGLQPGTFMLFKDHINNLGVSPMAGHQHLVQSPYVDMSRVYTSDFRKALQSSAGECGIDLVEGTYMANVGPQFETPAEVEFASRMGADALGMSTVLEASVAHALNARVAGISMITNRACGLSDEEITHENAIATGSAKSGELIQLIRKCLLEKAGDLL
jgi:purine-nucleoside phosphorylase